jgi:hypothetical protein
LGFGTSFAIKIGRNMSRYNFAKQKASAIMPILVDSTSAMVRFDSLAKLHEQLLGLAFAYQRKEEYGPKGGFQLFYWLNMPESALLVRIKTMGETAGKPRAGVPHLSVAVTDGGGDLWMNERAKLTNTGKLEAKSMVYPKSDERPGGFDASKNDFQDNQHYFVVVMGGKYDGPGQQQWADRVHFPFPPGTDFSMASRLP